MRLPSPLPLFRAPFFLSPPQSSGLVLQPDEVAQCSRVEDVLPGPRTTADTPGRAYAALENADYAIFPRGSLWDNLAEY